MLLTCPIAAAAAFSLSSETGADGGCACGGCVCGSCVCGDCAWGRACGGFIWAFAAGIRNNALTLSAAAANDRTRRVLAAWCSVQCMSFLHFLSGAQRAERIAGSKLMAD